MKCFFSLSKKPQLTHSHPSLPSSQNDTNRCRHPPCFTLRQGAEVRHGLLPAPRRLALGDGGAREARARNQLQLESYQKVPCAPRVPRRRRPGPQVCRRRRRDARGLPPGLRRRALTEAALLTNGPLVLLEARRCRQKLPGFIRRRLHRRVGQAGQRERCGEARRCLGCRGRERDDRRLQALRSPFGLSCCPSGLLSRMRGLRDPSFRGLPVPV